jgi:hypothetical protein
MTGKAHVIYKPMLGLQACKHAYVGKEKLPLNSKKSRKQEIYTLKLKRKKQSLVQNRVNFVLYINKLEIMESYR